MGQHLLESADRGTPLPSVLLPKFYVAQRDGVIQGSNICFQGRYVLPFSTQARSSVVRHIERHFNEPSLFPIGTHKHRFTKALSHVRKVATPGLQQYAPLPFR